MLERDHVSYSLQATQKLVLLSQSLQAAVEHIFNLCDSTGNPRISFPFLDFTDICFSFYSLHTAAKNNINKCVSSTWHVMRVSADALSCSIDEGNFKKKKITKIKTQEASTRTLSMRSHLRIWLNQKCDTDVIRHALLLPASKEDGGKDSCDNVWMYEITWSGR